MALQRSWGAIAPELMTANGTTSGIITLASTAGLYNGRSVTLFSDEVQPTVVTISRVLSPTTFQVNMFDASAFTTAQNAAVSSPEQGRPTINSTEVLQAVYEAEPLVALRTLLTDNFGNQYNSQNPLPVELYDGSMNIENLNQNLSVQLTALDNSPKAGDVHDSVRIGNGQYELKINADGSINVAGVTEASSGSTAPTLPATRNVFADVTVVPSLQTALVTYTVPTGRTAILEKVFASGQQVGRFDLLLNSATIDTQRTSYGSFNVKFDFSSSGTGFQLNSGDIVTLEVTNSQSDSGDFNARIQVTESIS